MPASDPADPAAVRVADELFRLLVSSVRDYAIFMLAPDGRVTTWNAGAERITGYTADEIVGQPVSTFYPDVERRNGKGARELEVAARTGRFEEEGWRVRKDGSQFWAHVVLTAVLDDDGALIGFAKVTHDLSERKAAEDQRRTQEARFRLLVDSVRDYAIFMLDVEGQVASWNPGAERIKGYRADEIIGRHFSVFYPRADVDRGKCDMELEVAARDGRFEDEDWRVRKDGSRFWANVVISAVRDDHGQLLGFSKVTRDLTDRVRAEEERAARLAAEQANRTKDEFLAMLGHELRNPLAPIVSALQLLKLRGDARSVREYQVIERQVNQMARLVDDLLDVSRVSRGKVVLHRRVIDLREPLAAAAEIALPSMERKAQRFTVDVPPAPLLVDGDDARLIQVFANLLNNANRYTHDGGEIALAVRHVDHELFVEVRDNGRGMEPALRDRVFELFVQGYQEAHRADGGLGIGLTLVRALVELHGGSVAALSDGPGKGSTFVVRLPSIEVAVAVPPPPREPLRPPPPRPEAARGVLIVDDNEDARDMLADMLAGLGHAVEVAGDGATALAALDRVQPDVAVLDIGLPGMDGYDLAAAIRSRPGHAGVRLIALTGYGQDRDRAAGARAGFDAYFVKPVDLERLLGEIAATPRRRAGG